MSINENPNNYPRKKSSKGLVLLILFLTLVTLLCYFTPSLISRLPLGKNISSLSNLFAPTNALLSGLTLVLLLYTIYQQQESLKMQREELKITQKALKRTAEANQSIANDTKANSIIELAETYASEHFFKIRKAAWKVLRNCIQNSEYCDYTLDSFFTNHFDRYELPENLIPFLRLSYPTNEYPESNDVKIIEDYDRHQLDHLLNFFTLLPWRDAPKEVFQRCDFFYDWWRPLLLFISELRVSAYHLDPQKMEYCVEPKLFEAFDKLDAIYDFEKIEPEDKWEYFSKHPVFTAIGLDPKHKLRFQ